MSFFNTIKHIRNSDSILFLSIDSMIENIGIYNPWVETLILKYQHDANNYVKVRIIQVIFHKVICFWVDDIFHFVMNSLVLFFNDWNKGDNPIPGKDVSYQQTKKKVHLHKFFINSLTSSIVAMFSRYL